jgi:hypothetical protein
LEGDYSYDWEVNDQNRCEDDPYDNPNVCDDVEIHPSEDDDDDDPKDVDDDQNKDDEIRDDPNVCRHHHLEFVSG